ncbi:MAG TPA: acyltransferase [Actinocrinis sp.]|nr:acyltransferase [Actinocrinis sp.]
MAEITAQREPTQSPPVDATAPTTTVDSGRRRPPRLAALDGLRFLAALLVVFYHFVGSGGSGSAVWGVPAERAFPHLSTVAAYCWTGVELFFLISGFVICMSSWNRTLGQFAISRATRLYPAYWFAVLATSAVLYFSPQVRQHLPFSQVITNLTMLQEPLGVSPVDGVYWTLWVEMRFYLLFAIVVWRGVTYRRAMLFCCLWTVAAVIDAGLGDNKTLDYFAMPLFAPFFIGGVAFYLIYRFGSNALAWGIVVLSWVLSLYEIAISNRFNAEDLHRQLPALPSQLAITAAFALMAALALGWFSRFNWRFLTVLGATTYPLYLLHENIGWTVIAHLRKHVPHGLLAVGTALLMVLFAWAVQRFVEAPVARRLRTALNQGLAAMREAGRSETEATATARE